MPLVLFILILCDPMKVNSIALPCFALTDLGIPSGSHSSGAYLINSKTQVIVTSEDWKGFLSNGKLVPRDDSLWWHGHRQHLEISVVGFDNAGHILGYDTHGRLVLRRGSQTLRLSIPEGTVLGYGHCFNNRRQFVGQVRPALVKNVSAFVWQNGRTRRLLTPPGTFPRADDINDKGQVVVSEGSPASQDKIYLSEHARWTDIGNVSGFPHVQAFGLNNRGQVLGIASKDKQSRAFLWEGGHIRLLGLLSGTHSTVGYDINDAGQVVGVALDGKGSRAVLWLQGHCFDLNACIPVSSGWHLVQASGINRHGQIVGSGYYQGRLRAFLLTPVRYQKR